MKISGKKFKSFKFLNDKNKDWVLTYLLDGKGVIPYEKLRSYEDLKARPDDEFFAKSKFFSWLRNEIKSNKE